ncbi:MAG: acyl-CoA dehydrogenase family protein [Gammaproteobacteria bacterium]
MDFQHSDKVKRYQDQVEAFMARHIHPNEEAYREQQRALTDLGADIPIIEELKPIAREAGLWNLFHSHSEHKLSNLEYAPLAEIMGRVFWASEVFNCSAPDTGNMETLHRFGDDAQKKQWLEPLLAGEIRSAFSMTEPDVASSDATNIQTSIRRDGDHYVINGRKWFTSGAISNRCKVLIVMGKTDPDNPNKYKQQSMILVPRDTPGVTVVRDLPVLGFYEHPHGHPEVRYDDVRVPVSNMLLGEGRGFEIAQGRLGPGRIHHAMRNIGQAEVALAKMCRRLASRVTFGRPVAEQSLWRERIANARIMIDQARFLVLYAADKMDRETNKAAKKEIAMAKVTCARMLTTIVDWAIQAHGAGGVTEDFDLGHMYARARVMHIVDGPDEVHTDQIGRTEIARHVPAVKK